MAYGIAPKRYGRRRHNLLLGARLIVSTIGAIKLALIVFVFRDGRSPLSRHTAFLFPVCQPSFSEQSRTTWKHRFQVWLISQLTSSASATHYPWRRPGWHWQPVVRRTKCLSRLAGDDAVEFVSEAWHAKSVTRRPLTALLSSYVGRLRSLLAIYFSATDLV